MEIRGLIIAWMVGMIIGNLSALVFGGGPPPEEQRQQQIQQQQIVVSPNRRDLRSVPINPKFKIVQPIRPSPDGDTRDQQPAEHPPTEDYQAGISTREWMMHTMTIVIPIVIGAVAMITAKVVERIWKS